MGSTRMIIVLFTLCLLAGCVMPENGTGGGGATQIKSGGKGGGNIVVCGESFTFGDVLEHPMFRQAFQQFITLQQLYAEAGKAGVTISDEVLQEEIDKQKEQVTNSGQKWEDVLEMQGMTEEEFKQMIKTQKLFEALVDTELDFSDENLQKQWDTDKDSILNQHIQANFLPEAERATLTLEDCKDTIKDFIRQRQGYMFQQEIMDKLTLNASIDLSGVLPADKAAAVTESILGRQQAQIRENQEGDGTGQQEEPGRDSMTTEEGDASDQSETSEDQPVAGDESAAGDSGNAPDPNLPVEPEPTETK